MTLSAREAVGLAELGERPREGGPAVAAPSRPATPPRASLRAERGSPGRATRSALRSGTLLALLLVLLALVSLPPEWQPAAALGIALLVAALLPRLVVRLVERVEHRDTPRRPGGRKR